LEKAVDKARNAAYFNSLLQSLYRVGGTKLVSIAVLTLVRTALLNYQGRLQGFLFKTAFLKQVNPFFKLLVENVALSFAASSVESTSKHVLELISIQWQEWITKRIHKKYFANMVRSLLTFEEPTPVASTSVLHRGVLHVVDARPSRPPRAQHELQFVARQL
jgi:ABC-type uncharacterized transport system fused permease/ATPase subunit